MHLSGVSNSIHANKDSLTLIAPEDAVAIAENYNHTDYANKESIYHPDKSCTCFGVRESL
ncbi:hypothetical protein EfmAA242_03480 [Enterococcus faecium]|nr:hypothetical protein EfmAA242_03480 [Enterococcus faecium]